MHPTRAIINHLRHPPRRIAAVGSVIVAGVIAGAASSAVARSGSGVYVGSSRPGPRFMKIALDVSRTGAAARWDVIVQAPCWSDVMISNELGTDQGPFHPLRIHAGAFRQSAHRSPGGETFSYSLAGHAVPGGFAGTFVLHVLDASAGRWCSTTTLHWRARRSSRPFRIAI